MIRIQLWQSKAKRVYRSLHRSRGNTGTPTAPADWPESYKLWRIWALTSSTYAFVGKTHENAVVVFRVKDIDCAIPVLQSHGVRLLTGDEIYQN